MSTSRSQGPVFWQENRLKKVSKGVNQPLRSHRLECLQSVFEHLKAACPPSAPKLRSALRRGL
jgi:hypothetical protein